MIQDPGDDVGYVTAKYICTYQGQANCLPKQGGTTLEVSLRPCSDAVDEGFFIFS